MILLSAEKDEFSGITTRYRYDEAEKKIIVQRWQDVESYVHDNVQEYNSYSQKSRQYGKEGLGRKIGSLPPAFVEYLWQVKGINIFTLTDTEIRKFFNDYDHKKFRTAPGRL